VGRKILLGTIIGLFLMASKAHPRTLVTIESEKARLTLALLSRLVRLEKNFKDHLPLRVLVILPQTKTAFQDQNIVNEAVKDFFLENQEFQATFVKDPQEALTLLEKDDFDILYVAGPLPKLKQILEKAIAKKVLTISHLPELLEAGLALSLDLDRRKACIVVNKETWRKLGLEFPPEVIQKFCFISSKK